MTAADWAHGTPLPNEIHHYDWTSGHPLPGETHLDPHDPQHDPGHVDPHDPHHIDPGTGTTTPCESGSGRAPSHR